MGLFLSQFLADISKTSGNEVSQVKVHAEITSDRAAPD